MAMENAVQSDAAGITKNVLVAIRKIMQSTAMNSRSLVKRVGLTGPQLMVLREVAASGEVSVGEVAKVISLSQGTVTGILERMEKRELVTRRRSETDRRRVMVAATAAGKQLLETAPPLMQEAFVERFGSLQDWEQAMILSSLQRLVTLMYARAIEAPPILAAGPIDESAAKPENGKQNLTHGKGGRYVAFKKTGTDVDGRKNFPP
jgi:DNA-binding MarR family transcriptional regulator